MKPKAARRMHASAAKGVRTAKRELADTVLRIQQLTRNKEALVARITQLLRQADDINTWLKERRA